MYENRNTLISSNIVELQHQHFFGLKLLARLLGKLPDNYVKI